ncbi:hypothetical protein [Antiquaquibacter soli]|uniref:Type I restriction modification DNA specificity domain-containing protein n=1 Tax=Antiquaquibacter soli TaxID=3064523 RepID=A0ABT9BQ30_9MICO|nr:hypothetical protein [Protaetiibacter sp. WY-16]MDO7883114.1 hypothetical protein [Protaetiibacter sp. WY-16]
MTWTPFGRIVRLVTERASEHGSFRIGLEAVEKSTGRLLDDVEAEYAGDGIVFRSGDVLFGKLRPNLRKAWLASRDGEAVGDFHVYRPNRELLVPRYLAYLVLSEPFLEPVIASVYGAKMPRADWNGVKQIGVWAPALEAQRAIADYLDRETSQIDAFIAKNEELIALLTERHEAQSLRLLLEQPTTQRVPLKAVLRKLRRIAPDDAPVVTAFRDGQVTSRANRRIDGFTETETESRGAYQGVKTGDVVYHGLDGFAGAVGVAESDGICSPVYHVCEVTSRADPEYIARLLRALGKSGFLEAYAWSVRQRSVDYRNWSTFAQLVVDLPAIDVQREVIEALSAADERMGRAVTIARRSIELARERRAALISAAVTGKVDVGVAT